MNDPACEGPGLKGSAVDGGPGVVGFEQGPFGWWGSESFRLGIWSTNDSNPDKLFEDTSPLGS